jgi:hypothetical protein
VLVCAQSNAAVDELVTRLDAQVHHDSLAVLCIHHVKAVQICSESSDSFRKHSFATAAAVLLVQGLFMGDGERQKARLVRMGKLESFSTSANRRYHIDAQAAQYATRGDTSIQGAWLPSGGVGSHDA